MLIKRLRHLPVSLAASGVMLILVAIVGGVLAGGPGAVGAALGVAFAAVTYVLSSLFVAWVETVAPQSLLIAGLTAYALKLFAMFGLLIAVTGWAGQIPLAMGIVAGVVAWTGAQIWWNWRAKIVYVDDPVDGPPIGGR